LHFWWPIQSKISNYGVIRHEPKDYKAKFNQDGGQNSRKQKDIYCCQPGYTERNCFKLRINLTITVVKVTTTVKAIKF
jgi:hypothetical protein